MERAGSPVEFYNALASDYDLMTGRHGAFERLSRSLQAFVDRVRIRSAIDAGCGTGLHAVALAGLGLRVVGIDLSPQMIEQARQRARSAGVEVDFRVGDLRRLDHLLDPGWDAVLCLGNTLPHLQTATDLRRFARAAFRLLSPGGLLTVQCLNYTLLRARDQRIVAITRSDRKEFIRFNDYFARQVRFNLLEIEWRDNQARSRLTSTMLRPWSIVELETEFQRAGFVEIRVFNGLDLTEYDPSSSASFVIVAHKPNSL